MRSSSSTTTSTTPAHSIPLQIQANPSATTAVGLFLVLSNPDLGFSQTQIWVFLKPRFPRELLGGKGGVWLVLQLLEFGFMFFSVERAGARLAHGDETVTTIVNSL
ncbi:hypothetical protein SLE2022_137330 [Rubroshorea leprosula]